MKQLERRLRRLAKAEGLSPGQAALRLLRKAAEAEASGAASETRPRRKPPGKPIGHALDDLAGTWTEEEAAELDKAVEIFEEIDQELWR